MKAQYSPYTRVKAELAFKIGLKLREIGFALRPQIEVAVKLAENSLPEPDITLTTYRGKGAVPLETTALVIEGSDTTLDHDLGRKSNLYPAADVPEYWVADLVNNVLHCHSAPEAGGYANIFTAPFGEPVQAQAIAGFIVMTADLLD